MWQRGAARDDRPVWQHGGAREVQSRCVVVAHLGCLGDWFGVWQHSVAREDGGHPVWQHGEAHDVISRCVVVAHLGCLGDGFGVVLVVVVAMVVAGFLY